MGRLLFVLPSVGEGDAVRIDTDSGSSTPANIVSLGGGGVIAGSVLHAGPGGQLPRIFGPADDTATLYLKQLDYRGAVTGDPVTLTGIDLEAVPASPGGSVPVPGSRYTASISGAIAHNDFPQLAVGALHAGDTPVLDVTDPTTPTFLEGGLYAVSWQVDVTTVGAPGTHFMTGPGVGTWGPQSNWPMDCADYLGNYAAGEGTWYVEAGDSVVMFVAHDDETASRAFRYFLYVQKIA